MMSISQQNLLKLARDNMDHGQVTLAIQNLEEALKMGHSLSIVLALSRLYRQNKQERQAYRLLKEEADLFSDAAVFAEYCQVLKANHFFIEALQVKHLSRRSLKTQVLPVSAQQQKQIMSAFNRLSHITEADYQQLLQLNLPNFEAFAKSLLLNPQQQFAVRLALCEDLVRLGIKEKLLVWVLGQEVSFVPVKSCLLEQDPLYREVIAAIGARFRNNPSQLPLMLGEANLVLGSLYPRLKVFVDEPDSFASDLVSYLLTKNGHGHQRLLQQIYQNLPNN